MSKFNKILTKQFLTQKYSKERLASTTIAKIINCSDTLVRLYLKKFKIKTLYNERFAPNYIDGRTIKEVFCSDCNKKLSTYTAKRCRKCYYKFSIGKNNPNFRHGWFKCPDCGKELKHNLSKPHRCWKCYQKFNKGANHPRWLEGISKFPYAFEFTLELKEEIRIRDSQKCQKCNKSSNQNQKESRKLLPVHHINYNKQDCRKENLITLCSSCHTKSNTNRDYWFAYYTYLMENR